MPHPLRNRIVVLGGGAGAGFDPRSIPGLALWLDASRLTLNDLDPVTTWPDLSGNGRDATQATTSKKPTFKIDGTRRVVEGDGTDDGLVAAGFDLTGASAITVFLVARWVAGGLWKVAVDIGANVTGYNLCSWSAGFFGINSVNSDLLGASHDPTTAYRVYTAVFSPTAASSTLRIDGVQQTVAQREGTSVNRSFGSGIALFGVATSNAMSQGYANLRIAEIAVAGPVSAGLTQQLETYLKTKWGTP